MEGCGSVPFIMSGFGGYFARIGVGVDEWVHQHAVEHKSYRCLGTSSPSCQTVPLSYVNSRCMVRSARYMLVGATRPEEEEEDDDLEIFIVI